MKIPNLNIRDLIVGWDNDDFVNDSYTLHKSFELYGGQVSCWVRYSSYYRRYEITLRRRGTGIKVQWNVNAQLLRFTLGNYVNFFAKEVLNEFKQFSIHGGISDERVEDKITKFLTRQDATTYGLENICGTHDAEPRPGHQSRPSGYTF